MNNVLIALFVTLLYLRQIISQESGIGVKGFPAQVDKKSRVSAIQTDPYRFVMGCQEHSPMQLQLPLVEMDTSHLIHLVSTELLGRL